MAKSSSRRRVDQSEATGVPGRRGTTTAPVKRFGSTAAASFGAAHIGRTLGTAGPRRATTAMVSCSLWAVLLASLLPMVSCGSHHSTPMFGSAEMKAASDYGLNYEELYPSPASLAKYTGVFGYPGSLDYTVAAAGDGTYDFYPTMMSETAFDNYGFGPKVKLEELLYDEPRRPATRHSSQVRDNQNRGDAKDSRERTERRRPQPDDDASSLEVLSRRPQERNRGGYYKGVPDREDDRRDEDEEEEVDDGPSSVDGRPSSTYSDRDEVAYSKSSRRPYIKVKGSSNGEENGPREYRPPGRDEDQEPTGRIRSTLGHRRQPSYLPGELPNFASEPEDKTEEVNEGFDGRNQDGAGDRSNGEVISPTPGDLLSYTTTENPEETTAYTGRTTSLSPSASNSRREPAYGPANNDYDSEQDEDRPIGTATEASVFRSTFEPPRYPSKDEARQPLDAAGDKFQSLLKNSQNRKLRKPAPSDTQQIEVVTTASSFTKNDNERSRSKETKRRGGYGTPPPLPPASSLILLARDPTPNGDQKAAATAVTNGADQKAAATGGSYRPRTLFHQQGFQGPYSYRFGFDTADPYNPQTRYEENDGNGHVKGSYSFLDPKGRIQVVHYEADPRGGFRAKGSFGEFPNKKP